MGGVSCAACVSSCKATSETLAAPRPGVPAPQEAKRSQEAGTTKAVTDLERSEAEAKKEGKEGKAKAKQAVEDSEAQGKGSKKKADSKFTREELERKFAECDHDHNGTIDIKELSVMLKQLGVKYTSKSVKDLLKFIDEDGSGEIDVTEFLGFFTQQKRGKGLDEVVQKAIHDRARNAAKHRKTDVYIIHAMTIDKGNRRSWWLANVLEHADMSCSGPYLQAALEPENKEKYGFTTPQRSADGAGDFRPPALEECSLLCLLIDRESLVEPSEVALIDRACDLGLPICCLYEASAWYDEDLINWKQACPLAMAQCVAKPMTRMFPRDSGESCVHHLCQHLKRAPPEAAADWEPGLVEHDDFSDLAALEGVRWIAPEFALVMDPGSCDLPDSAFDKPGLGRPIYISYAATDPERPGLSRSQLLAVGGVMKRVPLTDRVLYVDSVSLPGFMGKEHRFGDVPRFAEVLMLCEFLILNDVDPDSKIDTPYLSRGINFMEATIALLTGNILPVGKGQLQVLDAAVGAQVTKGSTSFREAVRSNRGSPNALMNRLCATLAEKEFSSAKEQEDCLAIFADVLGRHPFLGNGQMFQAAQPKEVTKRASLMGNFGRRLSRLMGR